MKRGLIILLLAISTCTSFVACGNSTENGTEVTEVVTAKSPGKIAEKFVEAIYGGNYKEAMSMLDLPEGSLADVETFKKVLSDKGITQEEIKKIKAQKDDSDSEKRNILVNYETEDGTKKYIDVLTKLTEDKKWAIAPDNFIVENWEVRVPRGSTIKINGNEVTAPKTETATNEGKINEAKFDKYIIPAIFKGNYEIVTEHPLGKTLSESNVYPKDEKVIRLECTDEIETKCKEIVTSTLNDLLANAKENKDFGELKNILDESSPDISAHQKNYNNLREFLNGGRVIDSVKTTYKDVQFKDISLSNIEFAGGNTIFIRGSLKVTGQSQSTIVDTMSYPFVESNYTPKFTVVYNVKDGEFKLYKESNFLCPLYH